jgi:hypothetical protein
MICLGFLGVCISKGFTIAKNPSTFTLQTHPGGEKHVAGFTLPEVDVEETKTDSRGPFQSCNYN